MKIGIITSGYLPMPPVKGGATENLLDLFLKNNEISKIHQLTVYSCFSESASKVSNQYKNSEFIYVNTGKCIFKVKQAILYGLNHYLKTNLGNAFILKVIKDLLKAEEKYEMIIVENRPEFIFPIRKVFKGKVVLHLHNDYIHSGIKDSKQIIDLYDAVFVVSEYIKKRVMTIKSETPVYTLYNGISIDKFDEIMLNEKKIQLKKSYGINDEDVIFLYTGRLNPSKGIDKAVAAFVDLPETINAKLIIVGSSVYGKTVADPFLINLKKLTKNNNKIFFTGYIDYSEIQNLYKIADIGLIPSIVNEAFGLTVVEHLASGNPVIVTEVGGIPEIIDSECAFKIRINSTDIIKDIKMAMITLYENKELRSNMSIAAKKKSKEFTSSIFCEEFNHLIKIVEENSE